MPLIVYFTSLLLHILLFSPETGSAVTQFSLKPLDQWKVLEGQNITFVWRYSLDGTIDLAKFINVTGGAQIAKNVVGTTTVLPNFQQRFTADISDTEATITMLAVKRSDQGKFEFDVTTSNGGLLNHEVELIVQSPPKFTDKSPNPQKVNKSSHLKLICEASGKPSPNITWTKDGSDSVLHTGSTWNLTNISSDDAGTYRCTADNGAGSAVSHTVQVIVEFPPRINLEQKFSVTRGNIAYLHCQVKGHPPPTITWTPCDSPENIKCDESFLNISKVQVSGVIYTCRASNYLGEALASTTLVIGGKNIYLSLIITSEKCTKQNDKEIYDQSFWEKLKAEVDKMFPNKNDYSGTELLNARCGESLHVDLLLKFKTIIEEDWALDIFRGAVKNGKLGELGVNASSIVGIPPVPKSTDTPPTTKSTPNSEASMVGPIVGGAVGGIALVAIIVAAVFFLRKKKCSKDSKVSDEKAAGPQNSGPSPGNNGYDDSGSAYAQPHPSSKPPTKTAGKKDKKPGKKGKDPEPVVLPLYAQVDKSKKKPKEPENTYDDANNQRKRQPGGLTYAAIDHSNQGASLPRGAANQPTRPAPYTETTYAVLV